MSKIPPYSQGRALNGLKQSARELDQAQRCLETLKSSIRQLGKQHPATFSIDNPDGELVFEPVYRSWQDFLNRLERVWEKFKRACEKHPSYGGWTAQFHKDRKNDPLLCYLRHARNADQHTLTSLTVHRPFYPQFIDGDPSKGIEAVVYSPRLLQLMCVTDRGVDYEPPTEHLGVLLELPLDPASLGQLALDYYRAMWLKGLEQVKGGVQEQRPAS